MKLKNQKHRKILRFYTGCFGFREPFKILCDGTFIYHLLANRIPLDSRALSKILGVPAKLFTTRCVIAELKSLGASYSECLQAARTLITARCDHEKRKSVARCIEEVIGEDNSEHFFVATRDTDIRKKFQEVAAVPILFGTRNSLFLDPPSESQRQHASKMEEKRLHATESEIKILGTTGKIKLAPEIIADAPDTHESLEDQVPMAPSFTSICSERRIRKKAKAPNPLSCKKKKNHGIPSSASNQDCKDVDKARRKRHRSCMNIKR